MMLLTKEIKLKLEANWTASHGPDGMALESPPEHEPAVKFFNPIGAATWLFSELDPDGDRLFGLCDLGAGFPELGYASLREITDFHGRGGLGIERDRYFKANKTLVEYANEARAKGSIQA